MDNYTCITYYTCYIYSIRETLKTLLQKQMNNINYNEKVLVNLILELTEDIYSEEDFAKKFGGQEKWIRQKMNIIRELRNLK